MFRISAAVTRSFVSSRAVLSPAPRTKNLLPFFHIRRGFASQPNNFRFRTIEADLEEPVLYKEKGSKFLTYAFQINNEAELKASLEFVKSKEPRATHHCTAYRYKSPNDPNQEISRANDDGEPAGSAGMPIFNRLLSNDLMNILVVVVRYYGGTKLGVAGLIKAYKESTELAIENSTIVEKELESTVVITFQDFQHQSTLFQLLGSYNANVVGFQTGEIECVITAKIQLEQQPQLEKSVQLLKQVSLRTLG